MNKRVTLLAALALGGCAVATHSTMNQLQASDWQLEGATGGSFTLTVADGQVVGNGGCNRYFGAITEQGDGVLTLGVVGATRMLCMGELADKERAFLQTLGKVATFSIDGNQLTLSDADQAALLTFNAVSLAQ